MGCSLFKSGTGNNSNVVSTGNNGGDIATLTYGKTDIICTPSFPEPSYTILYRLSIVNR